VCRLAVNMSVVDLRHVRAEGRQKVHSSAGSLLASGSLLALQWACYAWAIQHTSLSHTLLFLSATPVLLAAYTWLRRQPISAGQPMRIAWLPPISFPGLAGSPLCE